ncbi:four-carbon acid sugar kinase family protein [Siminovitchia sp. 179-K 8D1 HS]|uniref:four-carbon acid sugar kinase family protein n=1 Tax=Siminovitchia sp. 179-K 8D1 HS TaxID=3142385 RepID=UPI0039A0C7AA
MNVGVIADDLTGANATGVRLAKQGFKTITVVQNAPLPDQNKYDAICVDTDSRYIHRETAKKRVKEIIKQFKERGAKVYCKRIDSTARGNLGIEIDAVLEELGDAAIAVVVASYPDSGRTTAGGYLLVDGVPVQETDAAKDPIAPITKSYIPAIIGEQSSYKVTLIGLDVTLSGVDAITAELQVKISEGNRIIVFDAVNDEQIEMIAAAMANVHENVMVAVDPGPLTAYYSKAFLHKKADQLKLLVTVGSVTSVTGRQLHYLYAKTNTEPIFVDPQALASFGGSWEMEVKRAALLGVEALKSQSILIITTYHPSAKRLDLKAISKADGVSEDALAKRITDGLATITRKIIEQAEYRVSGVFSSGGDVTASLCAIGHANGIELEDEVLPLTAYGKFTGGFFDGLHVVTKGGMIGDNRAIYKSIKYMQTKISHHKGSVLNG